MPKPSLREKLLDAGFHLMWKTGYAATGVRDIVADAGSPQGSFTNHFRSKEDFACEILDRYFAYVSGVVADTLGDATLRPIDRLRRYLDVITQRLDDADWSRGCMIGNFSLETSAQNERLRTKLSKIFAQWRAPFAACIAEGQAAGEISSEFGPDDLADFLLSSWQGAMLRMKVDRSPEPLERFKKIVFATVFGKVQS
jgi:TetR/AcrR family transcriptional regulator, transcriptional repressor for nem operon